MLSPVTWAFPSKIFHFYMKDDIALNARVENWFKWWLLCNGWRNYWKDFRVAGRNRTRNLHDAVRIPESPSSAQELLLIEVEGSIPSCNSEIFAVVPLAIAKKTIIDIV